MKILYLPNAYSQQRQREKPRKIYPVRMAMEATWYKNQGHEVCWDTNFEWVDGFKKPIPPYDKIIDEPEGLSFLSLPHPDRELTRWWEYQDNGNFKYHPATYILSASGCWHGKCSFCVERGTKYEVREVDDVFTEIIECYNQGFKEVFDDSGTFPIGWWLDAFVMSLEDLNRTKERIRFSCNMRFNTYPAKGFSQSQISFKRLRRAGFRMLLFGLESASKATLKIIDKDIDVGEAKKVLKDASQAGLEPHIAVMFGYPWETDEDAIRTLKLVWYLLKKGYAKTAQASLYDPPDGRRNETHAKYVPQIYNVWKSPVFWFNKIKDIKNKDDLKYLWKQIKSGIRRGR